MTESIINACKATREDATASCTLDAHDVDRQFLLPPCPSLALIISRAAGRRLR